MPKRKRVLLVDDERSLRTLVRFTLGADEFDLFEAANGTDALAIARTSQPDLIILDVGMPEPDGYTVCRTLKSSRDMANLKVVMLTARSQPADRQRGTAVGVDAYITKPFSPTQLLNTVYELLS